jgi:hypothetical protein
VLRPSLHSRQGARGLDLGNHLGERFDRGARILNDPRAVELRDRNPRAEQHDQVGAPLEARPSKAP